MINAEEQKRMDRIIREVTARIPQRLYADDVLFLLQIIQRLADELEKTLKRLK